MEKKHTTDKRSLDFSVTYRMANFIKFIDTCLRLLLIILKAYFYTILHYIFGNHSVYSINWIV